MAQPGVLAQRYEDLISEPAKGVTSLANHLGFELEVGVVGLVAGGQAAVSFLSCLCAPQCVPSCERPGSVVVVEVPAAGRVVVVVDEVVVVVVACGGVVVVVVVVVLDVVDVVVVDVLLVVVVETGPGSDVEGGELLPWPGVGVAHAGALTAPSAEGTTRAIAVPARKSIGRDLRERVKASCGVLGRLVSRTKNRTSRALSRVMSQVLLRDRTDSPEPAC